MGQLDDLIRRPVSGLNGCLIDGLYQLLKSLKTLPVYPELLQGIPSLRADRRSLDPKDPCPLCRQLLVAGMGQRCRRAIRRAIQSFQRLDRHSVLEPVAIHGKGLPERAQIGAHRDLVAGLTSLCTKCLRRIDLKMIKWKSHFCH